MKVDVLLSLSEPPSMNPPVSAGLVKSRAPDSRDPISESKQDESSPRIPRCLGSQNRVKVQLGHIYIPLGNTII